MKRCGYYLACLISFVLGIGICSLFFIIDIRDEEKEIKQLILSFEDEVFFRSVASDVDPTGCKYPSAISLGMLGPKVVPYLIDRLKQYNKYSQRMNGKIGDRERDIQRKISQLLHAFTGKPQFKMGMNDPRSTSYWLKWWDENKDKYPTPEDYFYFEKFKDSLRKMMKERIKDKAIRDLIVHFKRSGILVCEALELMETGAKPRLSDFENDPEDGWYLWLDGLRYVILRYRSRARAQMVVDSTGGLSNGRFVLMRYTPGMKQREPDEEEITEAFLSWQYE
jgi:hypothetical protein